MRGRYRWMSQLGDHPCMRIMRNNERASRDGRVVTRLVIGAVIIAAGVTLVYRLGRREKAFTPQPVSLGREGKTAEDWETYHDKAFGFSLRHPSGWEVKASAPFPRSGGFYPLGLVEVAGPAQSGDRLVISVSARTPPEVFNVRPFYQPEGEFFYEAEENRWVRWPVKTNVCLEAVPIGAQSLPAYRFGAFYVLLLRGVVFEIGMVAGQFGPADGNLVTILESFTLDSQDSVIKARCV